MNLTYLSFLSSRLISDVEVEAHSSSASVCKCVDSEPAVASELADWASGTGITGTVVGVSAAAAAAAAAAVDGASLDD